MAAKTPALKEGRRLVEVLSSLGEKLKVERLRPAFTPNWICAQAAEVTAAAIAQRIIFFMISSNWVNDDAKLEANCRITDTLLVVF